MGRPHACAECFNPSPPRHERQLCASHRATLTMQRFATRAPRTLAAAVTRARLQPSSSVASASRGDAELSQLPPAAIPGRLTVCLDMDECLVHTEVADVTIKGCHTHSKRPHDLSPADLARRPPADFEFELPYLDAPVRVFKRPALDEFLVETSKVADLVLYTSAVEGYASEIIRRIDPDGTTFLRLLSRKHCRVLEHTGGASTPRRRPDPRVLTRTLASFRSLRQGPARSGALVGAHGARRRLEHFVHAAARQRHPDLRILRRPARPGASRGAATSAAAVRGGRRAPGAARQVWRPGQAAQQAAGDTELFLAP